MQIPPELAADLMEYLRARTYSRPHQRRAFIERLFDAPSTTTDLAKVANIGVQTAAAWRKHVLDYCKGAGVTMPHYFHSKRGRPPAQPPVSNLEDGQDDPSRGSSQSTSSTESGEEGVKASTPDTRIRVKANERRKPFVDNDTFRALVDDMVEDAHGARDHKAFSSVGKLKVEVTPGLKVPDTHLNINVSFLGPRGLDALNGLLADRIARLLEHKDTLPPEIRMLLSDRIKEEDLIQIAPVSVSSTDEAGREGVDTEHALEEIEGVFDES